MPKRMKPYSDDAAGDRKPRGKGQHTKKRQPRRRKDNGSDLVIPDIVTSSDDAFDDFDEDFGGKYSWEENDDFDEDGDEDLDR
jgi:hypothetical protein